MPKPRQTVIHKQLTVESDSAVADEFFTPAQESNAAMGLPMVILDPPPVFSRCKRAQWLSSLECHGVEGLLYVGIEDMEGDENTASECGFHEIYWAESGFQFDAMDSHLSALRYAGCYTASFYLPVSSPLSAAMCAVANIFNDDTRKYVVTLPQLLVASHGGFCPSYFCDDDRSEGSYRCFFFLGGYIQLEKDERETAAMMDSGDVTGRRGYSYVLSNPGGATDLSQPFISMREIYNESAHKYRLFPSDILVCKTSNVFVVELPIAGRMEDARMLTWVVRLEESDTKFPVPAAIFRNVPVIEEVLEDDIEISLLYVKELEEIADGILKISAREGSAMSGHMERKRVAPNIYGRYKLVDELRFNIC